MLALRLQQAEQPEIGSSSNNHMSCVTTSCHYGNMAIFLTAAAADQSALRQALDRDCLAEAGLQLHFC